MKSHYPNFDVLNAQEEWDPHTREIVLGRLKTGKFSLFTPAEVEVLRGIAEVVLHEDRSEYVDHVVAWFDNQLQKNKGESQRQENLPKEQDLVRSGLAALEAISRNHYGKSFRELEWGVRVALLAEIEEGKNMASQWPVALQKAFFKKVLVNMTKSYYSHPQIWSEIGYAGPAYPRGYVRTDYGLTDPWEAKRNGQ